MSDITFLSAGTVATNNTANTSNTPGIPAGCTNGQTLMVWWLSIAGDKVASLNTPSGWVKQGAQANSTNNTLVCYTKRYATGDTAPTATWTTNNKNVGRIFAYNSTDLTTPLDAAILFTTGTSGTPTSPSVTAATCGAWRIHATSRASTGTSTPDRTMIERQDSATSATNAVTLVVSDQPGMADGATGTRTDTASSAAWVGGTLWLRPATPSTIGILQSNSALVTGANAQTLNCTYRNTLTSGSFLLASVSTYCSGATGQAINDVDYASGTNWTQAEGGLGPSNDNNISIWYYENNTNTTAATVTARRGTGNDDITFCIYEMKGIATSSALDVHNIASGTASPASVTTPTLDGGTVLVFNSVVWDLGGPYTYDSDYATPFGYSNSADVSHSDQFRVMTGGSTDTVTMSGANGNWCSAIASFKAATGGGGGGFTPKQRRGEMVRVGSRTIQ